MELKNFLSRWSAESRVFLSRCIDKERSEDTLQRLLEKVNRVPLHEDFHFRVTNGQRAEVKRVLHCDATARADIRLVKSKCFPRTGTFSPNKDEISIRNKEPDGYQLR